MTKEMYWKSFLKTSWTGEEIDEARKKFPKIQLSEAIKGKR
jgi:hypothetical protein